MNRKKKILIHSNWHKAFTGLGKNVKNLLIYLEKTGKYELVEFANGLAWGSSEENNAPWKCIGSLPTQPKLIEKINSNSFFKTLAGYGSLTINDAIKQEKPDIYLGIEDIWAFNNIIPQNWWNKINCMIWTTLDSLPILPDAVNYGKTIKNYYVWASFAEKALKEKGVSQVKTLHGSIKTDSFFNIGDDKKLALRRVHGISPDDFIIGFVFRNQLRKSVGSLIEAFALLKKDSQNYKLLLHTNFSEEEGWDIPRFCNESGVSLSDVLTTFVCKNCKNYSVRPFQSSICDCHSCNSKGQMVNVSHLNGVSEHQLNEIYNLMDIYVHPFTSGGQEIPIQEAKLCELITLVTNYSCGEDMCVENSGGFPLKWTPYTESKTQFIKAHTDSFDIYEKVKRVKDLPDIVKDTLGKEARNFILNNYSIEVIGKGLEEIFDAMPFIEWNYNFVQKNINLDYLPKENLSDLEFIIDSYKNILDAQVDEKHPDIINLNNQLQNHKDRNRILGTIKAVAGSFKDKENTSFEAEIKKDKSPKIAVIVPKDTYLALIITYFLESIKISYPNHHVYVFCDNAIKSIFLTSDYIYKIMETTEDCLNIDIMEGDQDNERLFDVCYLFPERELLVKNYSHNNEDVNPLLKCIQ
jgi:glycosyltransferase involved in cell wall biosynthesis